MDKFLHGGQIYNEEGKAEKFLDFSANINPLGLSESVLEALQENLRGVVNYPDANQAELKNAISRRYNVPVECLILLNGAAEFFYLYFRVLRPKKVLIPVPSFSEYERAARSANCEVEYFFLREEDNFQLNTEKIVERAKGVRAKEQKALGTSTLPLKPYPLTLILGRPNNPTGNLISIDAVKKIAEVVPVVLDESFIDFLEVESAKSFAGKNLVVVQSLTKIFALPGLRLGFAVAEKNLAEKLNAAKDVWNVNFLAQKAGVAALTDEKFLADTRTWLEVEKKIFVTQLKKLPVKVFEPTVNFVLFKVESEKIAIEILKQLRAEKILLRSCANFVGLDGRFLRTAIKSRAENILLLNKLQKIFEVI